MATDVVQRGVVLVWLPVRGVGVQALPELGVPLVELPGQGLVSAHQGLAELGGCVAHNVSLCVGEGLRLGGRWLLDRGAGLWPTSVSHWVLSYPPSSQGN